MAILLTSSFFWGLLSKREAWYQPHCHTYTATLTSYTPLPQFLSADIHIRSHLQFIWYTVKTGNDVHTRTSVILFWIDLAHFLTRIGWRIFPRTVQGFPVSLAPYSKTCTTKRIIIKLLLHKNSTWLNGEIRINIPTLKLCCIKTQHAKECPLTHEETKKLDWK